MRALILALLFHHSFAAEFDRTKPVELKGTVTRIDWVNPHALMYLDVKNENGKVIHWACELESPSVLMRNGWSRYLLQRGDVVIVKGSRAKDGSNLASAHTVRMAKDGKLIFNAGLSGVQTK